MNTTSPKYRTKMRMWIGDNLVSCWPEDRKSAAENGINRFIIEVGLPAAKALNILSIVKSGTDAAYLKYRSLSPDARSSAGQAGTSRRCKYIQPSSVE